MQNKHNSIPTFKAVSSKPRLFLNVIFGIFWVFFVLFFLIGLLYVIMSSPQDLGLNVIATVSLFFIFLIALSGIVALLIYSRKKMSTTTIIDERGIRYLNTFNKRVIKDLPWSSFAKREKPEDVFESTKYDVISTTPFKSFYDQFYWPVLIDNKVAIHNDAFLGRHFFVMFYANRLELIRTFLLGVAHYRPDITVDPIVFSNHYIDPKTYNIDYRQRNLIRILAVLFCVLVLGLIYYFVD